MHLFLQRPTYESFDLLEGKQNCEINASETENFLCNISSYVPERKTSFICIVP